MLAAANSAVLLVGRILIGALFLVAGMMDATALAGATAYMARLGFPAPEWFAILSVVIEIAGGALLVIGWKARWAAGLLSLYVLVATGTAHQFWNTDAVQQANQTYHFLKNLAITGGLLLLIATGPGRLSADKN